MNSEQNYKNFATFIDSFGGNGRYNILGKHLDYLKDRDGVLLKKCDYCYKNIKGFCELTSVFGKNLSVDKAVENCNTVKHIYHPDRIIKKIMIAYNNLWKAQGIKQKFTNMDDYEQ